MITIVSLIGFMIGAYIVTRMLSFMARRGERAESFLVQLFAVITILLTLIIMVVLALQILMTPLQTAT